MIAGSSSPFILAMMWAGQPRRACAVSRSIMDRHRSARSTGQAVLSSNGEIPTAEPGPETAAAPQLGRKRPLFGLPCAKCRTYYSADQTACPVRKATERISPNAVFPLMAVNEPAPEDYGDEAALEAERKRFLREFRSQVQAA